MARVVVTVNVRDLTRADLARMRHNFRSLGDDLTNAVGNRTRQNFERLSQSVNQAARDLSRLRGNIPDAEFMRLDDAIRRSQRTMQRGFSNVGQQAFSRVVRQVQEVVDGFRDLDQNAQIRVHVDNSALNRADALLDRWRRDTARRTVQVRTDVDTNRMTRGVRSWILGPLPGLARFAGGTLSDGIGQGFANTFKSNPYVASALLVALVGAMSVVGAALAGVLVLAIGGAFVGLGAYIAAQSEQVTSAWERQLNRLKPMFREAAEPMIPVLTRATQVMGDMGAEFAPKLKEALEKAAPHINNFVDATKHGLRKLGEGAWDNLQEAFRVFLKAFGPEWEDFLKELGESLGALARTVTEHSTEMAAALRLVLGVINFLIDAVNFFANAWVMAVHFFNGSVAVFLDGIAIMLDGFLSMIDTMLMGLEKFADLMGMGDLVAQARKDFNSLRENAVGNFEQMADRARQLNVDLDNTNRKRKLEVDIESWNNELGRAKAELKTVPPEKKTELLGRIGDLEAKIRSANGQLQSMQKDYYVRIHAYKVGDWAIGGGGPGQAHGGVTGSHFGRAATGGARSNMTLVGEHGPEIVNLAPGSHVRSNSDTRRMMGEAQAPAGGTTIILKSSGRKIDDLLLDILRDAIHAAGGDPVRVLGGR